MGEYASIDTFGDGTHYPTPSMGGFPDSVDITRIGNKTYRCDANAFVTRAAVSPDPIQVSNMELSAPIRK